jgi:hypothetical protein
MSSKAAGKIAPIDPKRFHRALGIYQAAVAAEASSAADPAGSPTEAQDVAGIRAILAVKKEFTDAGEFHSLSLRLQRFAEVIADKKLAKWGMVSYTNHGGFEIHDAVINALAKAPFRKSGVLDKPAFHDLVKAEFERLKAEEE